MKKNNKKGFTLVELLAVIVVLAIIMLIAVNSVLPLITDARKGAFESSVKIIFEGAENAFTKDMMLGGTEIKNKEKCYDISYLVTNGYITKITADNANYVGYVKISEQGGIYDYKIVNNKDNYEVTNSKEKNSKDDITITLETTETEGAITNYVCPTDPGSGTN